MLSVSLNKTFPSFLPLSAGEHRGYVQRGPAGGRPDRAERAGQGQTAGGGGQHGERGRLRGSDGAGGVCGQQERHCRHDAAHGQGPVHAGNQSRHNSTWYVLVLSFIYCIGVSFVGFKIFIVLDFKT